MSTYILVVILAIISLLVASLGVKAVERAESENEILEAQVESSRMYQEALGQRIEQVRRYRHDADGLLRAIEHALRSSDELQVGGLRSDSGEGDTLPEFWSGKYPLVKAAVDMHIRQCAEAGIPFACHIADDFEQGIAGCRVEEAELCIVLQNLLDNAYEANCRIDAQADSRFARMMAFDARMVEGRLVLEVSNRTATSEQPTFRTQKQQQELHGVGMMVVQDIARKHGGTVTVSFDAPSRMMRMTVSF